MERGTPHCTGSSILVVFITRSQAIARTDDRTPSQQTINYRLLLNSIPSCFRDIGRIGVMTLTFQGHSVSTNMA